MPFSSFLTLSTASGAGEELGKLVVALEMREVISRLTNAGHGELNSSGKLVARGGRVYQALASSYTRGGDDSEDSRPETCDRRWWASAGGQAKRRSWEPRGGEWYRVQRGFY